MTVKYLTGAYPAGYALSAAYKELVVEAKASVGGTGVSATFYATILNNGVIDATAWNGAGVYLKNGGVVTNGSADDTTALIEASTHFGVFDEFGVATVRNFGTIEGGGSGVILANGGNVVNGSVADHTALIEFSSNHSIGVYDTGAVTLSNFGTIDCPSYVGVVVYDKFDGGVVTNGSVADRTALITGLDGVYLQGTITNWGTIVGSGGLAVGLLNSDCVLRVEAASVFRGSVLGGGSTLDLASGVGTIRGLIGGNANVSGSMAATNFTNFGVVAIEAGAEFALVDAAALGAAGSHVLNVEGTLDLVGDLAVGGTATVIDAGTVDQTGTILLRRNAKAARLIIDKRAIWRLDGDVGTARRMSAVPAIVVNGALVKSAGTGVSAIGIFVADNGVVEAATGTLDFRAPVTGVGVMKVDSGASLQFDLAVDATLTASFAGAHATLALSQPSTFAAAIAGFAATDAIDLSNIAATSAVLGAGDTLVITDGSTAVATLQLTGDYGGATFATVSDGHGGTSITVSGAGGAAPPAQLPAPHAFIAAASSLGAIGGMAHLTVGLHAEPGRSMLTAPRAMTA